MVPLREEVFPQVRGEVEGSPWKIKHIEIIEEWVGAC